MSELLLVDAGPLVAILAENDQYHVNCVEALKALPKPLLTTWAVLTEVAYLLWRDQRALQALFGLLNNGVLVIPPLDESISDWLSAFFTKYHDQEPQLADASLVYLAEQLEMETVFTLDRRHFSVFRRKSGIAFRLLPEVL